MKRVFAVLFAALVVTSSAMAADDASRQGLGIPGGNTPGSPPPDGPADVLIASSTNGGVFSNLAPNYQAAFTAAGAASVSTITNPSQGPFPFPVPFTSNEFGTIAILTNDNWHGASGGTPEANCSLQDETRIGGYMDTGGHMLFSGQDFLFARGNGNGFPQIYLGVQVYTDDINFGDTNVTYNGIAGGALNGLSGSLVADVGLVPCFAANPFFNDDVISFGGGLATYNSQPSGVNGQCGTTWDPGPFRTVFTSLDFACTTNTAQFHRDLASIYRYLQGSATSVEPSTWGKVKDMFGTR